MPPHSPLHLVVVPDLSGPMDPLLKRLSSAEQEQGRQRAGTARRHFVLGRLAAHAAIRRAAQQGTAGTVEVISGPAGEPMARVDGSSDAVSVSISHDAHMAAACAWRNERGRGAGVDLQRVRPTRIAESAYAFSRCEQAMLSRAPEGPVLAGLAGWVVKEAVWKALWPHQPVSSAAVEVRTLSLTTGRASVAVDRQHVTGRTAAVVRARLLIVGGPDGDYVLAVAQLGAARSDRGALAIDCGHNARTVEPHSIERNEAL